VTCKKCGKKIESLADYHSRFRCTSCYNKYLKSWNNQCDYNCLECKKEECIMPISAKDRDEKYIKSEIWE